MAERLVTPIDELTGLPLPIVPLDNPVGPDWHHHFHPKLSPLLQEDIGGKAVRAVRIQRVDYMTHHLGYHNNYVGPPLPTSDEEKFTTTIMSAAGYVPDYAIEFRHRGPRIVKLSHDQRHRLQTSGEIKIGGTGLVGNFIRQYVMQQQVESTNVNDLTIEEFLETQNLERRLVLGHTLLALITNKATEPVDEVYYQARKQHMLLPGLANNVQRFTKARLGSKRMREKLVLQLHARLVT